MERRTSRALSLIRITTSIEGLFRASKVAIAVPKDPPPNTTTLCVAPSTSPSFVSRLPGVEYMRSQKGRSTHGIRFDSVQ